MSLFQKEKKSPNLTIIVGCGRLGASIANEISAKDGSATVIDKDEHAFRKLDSAYGGLTITGDATNISLLQEVDIAHADTVISVTDDDNTNIMVAQIAKEIYHVPHVICRLYDPEREYVYHEFGIETICPVVLSAQAIAQYLDHTQEACVS